MRHGMRMETLLAWVEESQRRGEDIVVVIRNQTTREQVITTVSPSFVASLSTGSVIRAGEDMGGDIRLARLLYAFGVIDEEPRNPEESEEKGTGIEPV